MRIGGVARKRFQFNFPRVINQLYILRAIRQDMDFHRYRVGVVPLYLFSRSFLIFILYDFEYNKSQRIVRQTTEEKAQHVGK